MEYQNVLIAPDVFDYISRYYSNDENCEDDIDLRSYKENLKLKCLVLDKDNNSHNVYEEIKNIIKNTSDFGKHQLEIILNSFLESGRIKFITIDNYEQIVNNKKHNYLFNVGKSSNTKIINSQMDFLFYKNQTSHFEILNINEFNNPPNDSGLFNQKRTIHLTRGQKYNLYEKLKYYWINTETLTIEDDYLRKKDFKEGNKEKEGQFSKLVKLILTCSNLKYLKITTPFNDRNQNTELYLDRDSFKNEIIIKTGIEPTIENNKMGERHYYTDSFDIHFGKGLDFFNIAKNYYVYRPKVTITITPLKITK